MVRAADRDKLVLIPPILVMVVGVLVLMLRAVIAPLMLLAGVALSVFAPCGLAGLALREIGFPDVDATVPLWCCSSLRSVSTTRSSS